MLSYAQKRFFIEEGYLHVPGVIPPVMVKAALKAIHHSLGQEGIDPAKLVTFRSQSYCPSIQGTPVIADLLNKTPVWDMAEEMVGHGKLKPVDGGQIALRFPTDQDPPAPPKPHLDGMYTPHNGVPEGQIMNFTMLVGVLLSDVTEPYAGNFTVWPGTHRIYEAHFQEQGPESLLKGMPQVELPEPAQILGKAGDAVLVHYETGHTAALNVSHAIRYAIFFRLSCVDHHEHKLECMTDIWREWDGLRDLLEA